MSQRQVIGPLGTGQRPAEWLLASRFWLKHHFKRRASLVAAFRNMSFCAQSCFVTNFPLGWRVSSSISQAEKRPFYVLLDKTCVTVAGELLTGAGHSRESRPHPVT